MAAKQKKEIYQTVGQRILEALSKLTFEENVTFKRDLRRLSDRYWRVILKENYDKDRTPHNVTRFFVHNLHMDYEDFTPQNLIEKNHVLYMNLGLKKPEKTI